MNDAIDAIESEPVTTWRQKQRQVREEAILDAAREMIAEHGYDAMTMEDLSERVGISKPTLYQHFPSKEALAVRAVVAQMERSLAFMRETQPNRSASWQIERVVRQMVSQRFDCAHIYSGTKMALAPIVRSHPEYKSARDQMVETLETLLESAKAEGAIEPALSTRVLIQILFSLMRDTEYDELIKNGACREDEVRDTLTALYLTGLRRTNP